MEEVLVGIDENGLGPILGPLLVTGVGARVTESARRSVTRRVRGGLAGRMGDSKRIVSFGDTAQGEAWARALLEHVGVPCTEPHHIVKHALLDGEKVYAPLCPKRHREQCWGEDDAPFEASPEMLKQARRDIRGLAARGIALTWVRSVLVCTKQLNREARQGTTRLDVDLHAMERLIVAARDEVGSFLHVTCGKVGGYHMYDERFSILGSHLRKIVLETRAKSTYLVPHVGEISFVRDAEDHHMLVALASLVGKYLRDLVMARIVRYHQRRNAALPSVSGYHDPITKNFIAASALIRKKERLPDDCFARIKAVVRSSPHA